MQQAGAFVVAAYRKLAALEGCAPSFNTSDAKILEIYTITQQSFREAAHQRGEHLPASTVNFIVLKFLTCYESFGEQWTTSHLAYEAEKYRREGLRPEYRRELDLLAIVTRPPKTHPTPAKTAVKASPEAIPDGPQPPLQKVGAPCLFIPLTTEKQAAEAAAARLAHKRWRSRLFLVLSLLVLILGLTGIGLLVNAKHAADSWKTIPILISKWGLQVANLMRPDTMSSDELYARAFALSNPSQREPDYSQAAILFQKAAVRGHLRSMVGLGVIYAEGPEDFRNYAVAEKWLRLAAEQGDAFGQFCLGLMYANGSGVTQSDTEAVKWYRLSAKQGNTSGQYNLGWMYENGRGVAQSNTEAVRWYRIAAEQGDAGSQVNLGQMYANGRGVAQSDTEAVKWYRLAAEQGDESGQCNLGWMYENGKGLVQSDTEAVKWYRLAAEQNDATAQGNLGWMYENGRGVAQSNTEAVNWYRLAAAQGDVRGQRSLGLMYENGSGVAKSYVEAVKWYRQAADQGDATGQHRLASMYEYGIGVTQNYTEAVKWYQLAAERDDVRCQFELARMYGCGLGVDQSDTEAVKWYRLAAQQGHVTAQLELGVRYTNGSGVTQSDTEGLKWHRLAAEQGHPRAQYNLGSMYKNGRGVAQNVSEALKWYRLAADQGEDDAQCSLGSMYAQGHGVAQNDTEAVKWYRLAAEQGNDDAQCKLGLFYVRGRGVTQSDTEAVRWLFLSADQRNATAQCSLGWMYGNGRGVATNYPEAVKWYRLAADQGNATAQLNLGALYAEGRGVPRNDTIAYKWLTLGMASGDKDIYRSGRKIFTSVAARMTAAQIAEGQKLAASFAPKAREERSGRAPDGARSILELEGLNKPRRTQPDPSESGLSVGTGFFIDRTGHLLTAHHVVKNAVRLRLRLADGSMVSARVIRSDPGNDVSMLKADHRPDRWLELSSQEGVSLGQPVFTIGFPNAQIQGIEPKYNDGKVGALSGIRDDPRHLQTSLPATNGNSGGPLLDADGRVVGLIVHKLNDLAMLKHSGNTGQSVSYALKTEYLKSFLPATALQAQRSARLPVSGSQFDPAVIDQAKRSVALVVADID